MFFSGISCTQKRYWCYDPITCTRHVNVDVTFFEGTPYYSTYGKEFSTKIIVDPPIPQLTPLDSVSPSPVPPPLHMY